MSSRREKNLVHILASVALLLFTTFAFNGTIANAQNSTERAPSIITGRSSCGEEFEDLCDRTFNRLYRRASQSLGKDRVDFNYRPVYS
jgi:hypothetical protein